MRVNNVLRILAFTLAGAAIVTLALVVAKVLPPAKAQGKAPMVLEMNGQTYMLLSEADAQKLNELLAAQRALIEKQREVLAKGGCV